jgi:hypothetical protein
MPQSPSKNALGTFDANYARWAAAQHGSSAPAGQNSPRAGDSGSALLSILKKRRKALSRCILAALICASLLTMWFRERQWKHNMTVAYTPSTLEGPTPNTLPSFLQAPQVEGMMRTEFPDYDFGNKFEEAIEVKVPYGTQTVEIGLVGSDNSHAEAFRGWVAQLFQLSTWSKPPRLIDDWNRRFEAADFQAVAAKQESARVLNRLRAVFAQTVAQHCRDSHHSDLLELRAELEQWNKKLKSYKAELAEFHSQHRVQDLESEIELLVTVVTQWEGKLEDARLAKTSSEHIRESIRRQKESQAKDAQSATSDPAVTGDPAADVLATPQRQIERERRRMEVERLRSEVAQAKKQFEYDTKLHEKQFISDAVYAQKKLAMESIERQLEGAERIWKLELQVDDAEGVLPAELAGGGSRMIAYLEAKVASKRKQLARLQSLRQQAERLDEQILIANNEVQRIRSQVIKKEQLEKSKFEDDFKDIRPATLDTRSIKNTGKKWFLVTFVLCCLVFGAPVIARDLVPPRKDGAAAQAEQLGIPVLVQDAILPESASRGVVAADEPDERARLLALRIQQAVPRTKEGAVVLFSGLEQSADVSLLARLSDCWARRGERVLLLDTGDDHTVQAGLASLLAADQVTLEHRSAAKQLELKTDEQPPLANGAAAHASAANALSDPHGANGVPQLIVNGLTDFLLDDSIECQSLIQKTEISGVDCVMAGDLPMPVEGLATHRMTEFLHAMRERYSLIVLMGPSTSRPVDLELLASRADGIVFSTDGSREVSERSHAVVRNLIELNAPVLGVIS